MGLWESFGGQLGSLIHLTVLHCSPICRPPSFHDHEVTHRGVVLPRVCSEVTGFSFFFRFAGPHNDEHQAGAALRPFFDLPEPSFQILHRFARFNCVISLSRNALDVL